MVVDVSIHDVEEIPLPNSISTKRRDHDVAIITYDIKDLPLLEYTEIEFLLYGLICLICWQ
jgi:hypothetical protein